MRKYLTEFIGTFFLVLTIGLAGAGTSPAFAPIAIGSVLMVMVYMGGHISGGHYNPAVSLAVLIRGKLGIIDFVFYLVAQVAGALAAAWIYYYLKDFAHVISVKPPDLQAPADLGAAFRNAQVHKALLVEGLYTFALALVVLNAATAKKTTDNSFYGLAIGFTVLVGAFAVGPISGGAFNPAVATGPAILEIILKHADATKFLWLYLVGPFVGGALAGIVFLMQETDES